MMRFDLDMLEVEGSERECKTLNRTVSRATRPYCRSNIDAMGLAARRQFQMRRAPRAAPNSLQTLRHSLSKSRHGLHLGPGKP